MNFRESLQPATQFQTSLNGQESISVILSKPSCHLLDLIYSNFLSWVSSLHFPVSSAVSEAKGCCGAEPMSTISLQSKTPASCLFLCHTIHSARAEALLFCDHTRLSTHCLCRCYLDDTHRQCQGQTSLGVRLHSVICCAMLTRSTGMSLMQTAQPQPFASSRLPFSTWIFLKSPTPGRL